MGFSAKKSALSFSLRSLLAVVVLTSLCLYVAPYYTWKKSKAIAALEGCGASISYDYEWAENGGYIPDAKNPGSPMLRLLLGKHYGANPVRVELFECSEMTPEKFTDEHAKYLVALDKLDWLVLMDTSLTDEGLEHLRGLTHLGRLDLDGSKVTQEGVERLRRWLPDTDIYFEED